MIKVNGVEYTLEQARQIHKALGKEYEENKDKNEYYSEFAQGEMLTKYVYYLLQYLEMSIKNELRGRGIIRRDRY